MKLVIVESPTKAKTLSRFLGPSYTIEASMGHIRDLPQKGGGLAIDIEHNFEPQYEPIAGKSKKIAELKRYAKEATQIYLATDPDREGEAIAWHVSYLLGKREYERVTFHEITRSAIEEALRHPGQVNMELVASQQARRVLDRLVGYKLSPVLWKKVRRGLSAGRVQSVAVRLVVEREAEIKAFIPEEYWEIFADLQSATANKLRVELMKIEGKKAQVKNGEQAKGIVADLKQAIFTVSDVATAKQTSSPNPPFTTSLLQRSASNLYGWSAKQTMSVAQSLYEQGYITYHRTDSYNLAKEAVAAARTYIESSMGRGYVPAQTRFYKIKSKGAQEAHEAIRPTNVEVIPEFSQTKEKKLYELIRNRFLMCQMADAVFDKTAIVVEAGKYELRAEGKRLIFDGWLRLGKQAEDVFVPQVTAGENLSLVKIDPQQKFTAPPGRFTEAGLIKELEKRGIGRPSTYASIISTIQLRGYVVKEEKSFHPTVVGEAVTEFLVTNFPTVVAYEFTAKMEADLDEIAEGKKKWVEVVREFYTPFEKKVGEVEETGARVKVAVESTGEKCPLCKEGEVVIRTGRFGKFYSCSTYPTCKYTKQYVEYVAGHLCPEDGGRVVVKKSKRGKFYGCENYPKCKWAAWKLTK